jgi:putative endonuclease
MSGSNIRTGKQGEALAAAYLTQAGYRIVERNYRCIFGEIDIVAEEGGILAFVEVKSRRSDSFGVPQLAVGSRKQRSLSRVALHYLGERHLGHRPARFDVVSVLMAPGRPRIELIRNAFELAGG